MLRIGMRDRIMLPNSKRRSTARPFAVLIRTGSRPKLWGNYGTAVESERVAARLRGHLFDAIAVDAREAAR